MAYGPQSVSLTQAGGDLDLLEALRGGRGYRAKTQAQMLREQSMAPVEVGSYNGIQGKFPISQGINKIAQGLLASYMENRERGDAQDAATAQRDAAQKWAAALGGAPAVAAQPGVQPEMGTIVTPGGDAQETPEAARVRMALERAQMTTDGAAGQGQGPLPAPEPGQRIQAAPGQGAVDDPGVAGRDAVPAQAAVPLSPAQRAAMLMQGMGSGNPAIARMAEFSSKQDETARLQAERLASQEFQRKLQREQIAATRADADALRQPARDEKQRLIDQDKAHRAQAVEFLAKYQNASPDDRQKLLIEAQFSGNPYLTKGATHIGDQDAKTANRVEAERVKSMNVPPPVLKQYGEHEATARDSSMNLGRVNDAIAQIDDGKLNFGVAANTIDSVRNTLGFSNEESRNKASYQNMVRTLANNILQAAKGTQTEGDARRVYDLIVGGINDKDNVRDQLIRLGEISAGLHNTSAKMLNISGRAHPGLEHEPVEMVTPKYAAAPPSAPPDGAVEKLRGDPSLAAAFDAKYGPGAAKKALGR